MPLRPSWGAFTSARALPGPTARRFRRAPRPAHRSQLRRLTQDCSDGRGGPFALKFSDLTLTPDPPVPGKAAEWIANSTAGPNAAVSSGTGNVVALLDGIPVYTSPPVSACGPGTVTLPLGMGVMHISALACPVAANAPASVSMALTLAAGTPKGDFAVVFKANGVFCLNATFKIA